MHKFSRKTPTVSGSSLQKKMDEVINFNTPIEAMTPVDRIHKIIKQLKDINGRIEKLSAKMGG